MEYFAKDFTVNIVDKTISFRLKNNLDPFTYQILPVKNGTVTICGNTYNINEPIVVKASDIMKFDHVLPITDKLRKAGDVIDPVTGKLFKDEINDPNSAIFKYLAKNEKDRVYFNDLNNIEFIPLKYIPRSSHGYLLKIGAVLLTGAVVAMNIIPGVGEAVDVGAGPEAAALDVAAFGAETAEAGVDVFADVGVETEATESAESANSKTTWQTIKNRFGMRTEDIKNVKNANISQVAEDTAKATTMASAANETVKSILPKSAEAAEVAEVATADASTGAVAAAKNVETAGPSAGLLNPTTGEGRYYHEHRQNQRLTPIILCMLFIIVIVVLIMVLTKDNGTKSKKSNYSYVLRQ
jgi:hypothetical protein